MRCDLPAGAAETLAAQGAPLEGPPPPQSHRQTWWWTLATVAGPGALTALVCPLGLLCSCVWVWGWSCQGVWARFIPPGVPPSFLEVREGTVWATPGRAGSGSIRVPPCQASCPQPTVRTLGALPLRAPGASSVQPSRLWTPGAACRYLPQTLPRPRAWPATPDGHPGSRCGHTQQAARHHPPWSGARSQAPRGWTPLTSLWTRAPGKAFPSGWPPCCPPLSTTGTAS